MKAWSPQFLLVRSRIWERPGPAELLLQMCWIWSRCVESCRKKAALGSFIFSTVKSLDVLPSWRA